MNINHIDFDFIITVCDHAKESCPFILHKTAVKIHKNFFDPSKADSESKLYLDSFRKLRIQIREYCKDFVKKHPDIGAITERYCCTAVQLICLYFF